MNQGAEPTGSASQPGPANPYERLGIGPEASFDAVQAAKRQRLEEVGEDPQARARIEAAYDAVLMDRLKERQQGKVSSAALNASQREATRPSVKAPPARPSLASLPSLPSLPKPSFSAPSFSAPTLGLADGVQRWLPLGAGAVLLGLLLLLPASNAELVLAFATVLAVVNLQRRNGRLLPAAGWSVLLLSVGLLLGGLLLRLLDPSLHLGLPLGLPLDPQQVQSLPALALLVLGALLIA
ncbi:MAG: CPP1-like family protein [Vulcanococcus sp.]